MRSLEARVVHEVKCRYCGKVFDLVGAMWCGCGVRVDRPSKVCPNCLRCICLHPDYNNEALWGNAPTFLKKHGFDKLFYVYV